MMVDQHKPNSESPISRSGRREITNVLSSPLGCKIKKLETANLPGYEVLQIDVTDSEIWKSQANENSLVRLFGKLSTVAFAPRDRKINWNPTDPKIYQEAVANLNEICESDRIFVAMKDGKAVGFASSLTSDGPQNSHVADLMLTVVDPNSRGTPIAKELNQLFFSQNVDAFVAISHNPAAVKNFLAAAREKNLNSYFCGQKNGKWGELGSDQEMKKMSELDEDVKTSYRHEYPGRVIDSELGYVGIKRTNNTNEIQPIPPVTAEELNFGSDNSVKETFEKGLLAQNAKYAPHTMYGTLIAFR
ncbi:MAG: hypothetical protein V1936_04825 [Patescibacteria group bacterium]